MIPVRLVECNADESPERSIKIGHEFIWEESPSGFPLNKWFLHSVESCDILSKEPLTMQISFSNKAKKTRIYSINEKDYDELLEVLRPVLAAHVRHAMQLGVAQCVRCQTEFSHDFASGKKTITTVRAVIHCHFNSLFCRWTFYGAVEYSTLIKIISKYDEKSDRSAGKENQATRDGNELTYFVSSRAEPSSLIFVIELSQ